MAPSADRIDFTPSSRLVVGHEVNPLPDVRRPDAASREIDRPAGVVHLLHFSEKSIEPTDSNRRTNLFSKDDCRAALADEP